MKYVQLLLIWFLQLSIIVRTKKSYSPLFEGKAEQTQVDLTEKTYKFTRELKNAFPHCMMAVFVRSYAFNHVCGIFRNKETLSIIV